MIPPAQLPTQLYPGKAVLVLAANCIEIDLQLGFGVSLRKRIVLEGVRTGRIPRQDRREAKRCLVVLVGGKRVLVHTDQKKQDGYLLGRVYLNERVYGEPPGMLTPYGLDEPMLEVSTFVLWLADRAFDTELVKLVLNGPRSD